MLFSLLQIARIGKSISLIYSKKDNNNKLTKILKIKIIKENNKDNFKFCFLLFIFILNNIGIINKLL